ncbi:Actin-fragmin kinase [Diplonema papillatum]|nr:Actin-fragmin kinase [Diplonema papillatum]
MSAPQLEKYCPTAGYTAVVYENQVVVFGGKRESGTISNDVWTIDADDLTVHLVPSRGDPPPGRCYHSAHVHRGAMFVIHGITERGPSDPTFIPSFQLSTGQWSLPRARGDIPTARCNHASSAYNSVVYVLGGYVMGEQTIVDPRCMFALNLDNLVWSRVEGATGPVPGALWGHSLNTCGSYLVAFGGVDPKDDDVETDQLWFYSFARNRWMSLAGKFSELRTSSRMSLASSAFEGREPKDEARPQAVAVADFHPNNTMQMRLAVGDAVSLLPAREVHPGWVYGCKRDDPATRGYFPEAFIRSAEGAGDSASVSTPARSPMTTSSIGRQKPAPAPEPRLAHASCVANAGKCLVVWGGEHGDNPAIKYDDAWVFNVNKGKWKQVGRVGTAPPKLPGQQPMVTCRGLGVVPMLARGEVYVLDPVEGWSTQTVTFAR